MATGIVVLLTEKAVQCLSSTRDAAVCLLKKSLFQVCFLNDPLISGESYRN